jgi:hypothetical protein
VIPAVLAALMFAAALACVLPGRRGRNMTVATAAVFMGLAFVCTVPAVYVGLDAVTGNVDVADLVKHSFFVVAVSFLARGVVLASGQRVPAVGWSWAASIAVLVLQAVAFALVEGRHGSTAFMTEYGGQPAAAVYSITHFGYFGLTFVGAALACLASGSRAAPRAVRAAVSILLVGSVASVATAALLVVRDLVRVAGDVDLAATLNRGYQPMLVLSVLFVAVGLAFPPIAAGVARRRIERAVPGLVSGLAALRDRLSDGDGRLRLPDGVRAPGARPSDVDRVHRLVIEVRDQLFLHPDATLTEDERTLLERGESLLEATDID